MLAIRSRRYTIVAASLLFGLCFLAGMAAILLGRFAAPVPPGGIPVVIDPGNGPVDPGAGGGIPGQSQGGGGDGDVAPPTHPTDPYEIYPGQTLLVPVSPQPADPVKIPDPPEVVTGRKTGTPRVALTFDCGWVFEPVPSLLQVLDTYGLDVTFFPRGKWIEDHPQLVLDILARGHEIGSHSYTHPDLTKLTAAQIDAEIRLAKEALLRVAGQDAFRPLYRPPYGAHNAAVSAAVARYGYGWVVMWQVDSLDWREPGVDAIVERVLRQAQDGGIVLMHVGTTQTVEALPRIIQGLQARGYRIVQVSELLGIKGGGQTGPDWVRYTVRAGDTVYGIAKRFGTTVDALMQLNPELGSTPRGK